MKGLPGKRVLVTGASSGIGQAIAVRFAEEGCHVGMNFHRNEDGAKQTEQQVRGAHQEGRHVLLRADIADTTQVVQMCDAAIAELGGIDILINNAGYQICTPTHEMSFSDFASVIATNLTGAFACAQQVLKHMMANHTRGVVINVSSVHEIIPKPQYSGYSASKGGMRNLTRTWALEYAPHGIRVNGIGPGATITPMNEGWINDAEKRALVESHIPMGRPGTSQEMAAVTAFLCSDDAAYITGQTIFVDGGLTLFPEFGTTWA